MGFYGSLVGINAYHQPGVEAGKKAAAAVLALQTQIVAALSDKPQSAEDLATVLGAADKAETVYHLLEHLAANGRARKEGGTAPSTATFRKPG